MKNRLIEAAQQRDFLSFRGPLSLYESTQILLGSAIIAARDGMGLSLDYEELVDRGRDTWNYDDPYEVGRWPLRLGIGGLATTSVVAVAKVKGWA